MLIMLSRSDDNWLAKFLSLKPIVFLGTFAYSIYLTHAPLLQIFWQYPFSALRDKPLLMAVAQLCIGTPIIIGLSYLFFLTCERPFISKKAKQQVG